jgi:hypothetical protein
VCLPENKSEQQDEDDGMENKTKYSGSTSNSNSGCVRTKDGSKDFVGKLVNNSRGENQEEKTSNQGTEPLLGVGEFKVQQIL